MSRESVRPREATSNSKKVDLRFSAQAGSTVKHLKFYVEKSRGDLPGCCFSTCHYHAISYTKVERRVSMDYRHTSTYICTVEVQV